MRGAAVVLCCAAAVGCAVRPPAGQFGDPGLAREQYTALDSILGDRVGRPLMVEARTTAPLAFRPRPMVDTTMFHRFHGRLVGAEEGWLLLRRGSDTLRIGKASITGVHEVREGLGWGAGLLGAAAGAGIAALLTSSSYDGSTEGMLIGVGGLLGGVLGRAVLGRRSGRRLYPPRGRTERRWFGDP